MIEIEFIKETHKYIKKVEQTEVPSATTIINAVLGSTFTQDNIYMRQARDKGTLIHRFVEDWVKEKVLPTFDVIEFNNFRALEKEQKLKFDISELILYCNIDGYEYCGTADLIDTKNGILSDVKTGSTKNIKKWQLQLSMYYYALKQAGVNLNGISIIWVHKDKKKYIELDVLPIEEIKELLIKYYENREKIGA